MRLDFRLTICALLTAMSMYQAAWSQQLAFNKVDKGDSYTFQYQWLDVAKQPQSLSFTLSKKALFSPFRHFRAYNPELAAKYVQKHVRKSLKKSPLDNVSVRVDPRTQEVMLRSNNRDALLTASAEVNKRETEYFQQYLEQQFYHQFTTYNDYSGIKPDHVRIALESVEILDPTKPAILEKTNVKNVRRVTNYVLNFVQSIPYSTLESRLTSSGAGFNVPTKVLWENQGDCDSKMTLTASLLRRLMPRIKLMMVYIDQHAFIGIDILPEPNDVVVEQDGRSFVLADPTGPKLLKLGELPFDSEQAIYSGHYTGEVF
ncbi:hypothetical protein ACFSJY_03050 [Thalassotalea euphylliae]|uniref:hypothetical protein n=1 Tax=Thalassotalea euphylliae TaxID=1655234 RepID=UPI0036450B4E